MKCFICNQRLLHVQNGYKHNKSVKRAKDIADGITKWAHGGCVENKLQDYEDAHNCRIKIMVAAGLIKLPEKLEVLPIGVNVAGINANRIIYDDPASEIEYSPKLKESMEKWYEKWYEETLASILTGGTTSWRDGNLWERMNNAKEIILNGSR